jgi:hypothetical protein
VAREGVADPRVSRRPIQFDLLLGNGGHELERDERRHRDRYWQLAPVGKLLR